MKKSLALLIVLACGASGVQAKLPPPTPEAKAAADAAKDKAAWSDKVASYKLCLAQDKVAAQYLKSKEGAKKPTVETPPCADPGPYTPPAAAAATPATGTTPTGNTPAGTTAGSGSAAAAPAGAPASTQASVAPANATTPAAPAAAPAPAKK